MTRWPGPISSQVRGRPRATGRLSLSSAALATACCGFPANVATTSLYSSFRMFGTKPRPLAYSRPMGSFLAMAATSGWAVRYTLNPIRSAALATRSGLPSSNRAPRGFCWSSNPRTIRPAPLAAGATGDRLLADVLDIDALDNEALVTVLGLGLRLRFVMTGLQKSRRAPEEGPCGGLMDKASNRRRPTRWILTHR